jgi:polysaccharide biosynthesis protein PslH
MKILFVVPYVPSLIYVRPYNLIRHLAERGHQIHLLTLAAHDDDIQVAAQMEMYCSVTTFPLPRWRSLFNAALTLPTSSPLQAAYCWQPAAARWLEQRIKQEIDDVIHVEHLRGARYGLTALKTFQQMGKSAPVIWDSVDCISYLFRQASSRAHRLSSRLITTLEANRTAHFEGNVVGQFRQVLVTSPVDRQALLELATDKSVANITVLPNGSNLDYFTPDDTTVRESATLVITGKMSYHANVAMTLYLVREVLPKVWAKRPDVKLWVVGKDPAPELLALRENPNISITGTVDDIRPYLRRATLAVSPILYGAGIQNKLLEAMACGTPVVTTPQAVLPLAVQNGVELCIANEPETFAQSILNLLTDDQKRNQLGLDGRRYVEQNHDWGKIVESLESLYKHVM